RLQEKAADAAARTPRETRVASRPLGRRRAWTRTVRTYVAAARPRIRANPWPRSERRGKSRYASGTASAPTAARTRDPRLAAVKAPPGSSGLAAAFSARARSARWGGVRGAMTRRCDRGNLSQSERVGTLAGSAAERSLRAATPENPLALRKSSTRGWS